MPSPARIHLKVLLTRGHCQRQAPARALAFPQSDRESEAPGAECGVHDGAMFNTALQNLRAGGVILGQVLCFARIEDASRSLRQFVGGVIVRVPTQPDAGTFWVMADADAQRMVSWGFKTLPPVFAKRPPGQRQAQSGFRRRRRSGSASWVREGERLATWGV